MKNCSIYSWYPPLRSARRWDKSEFVIDSGSLAEDRITATRPPCSLLLTHFEIPPSPSNKFTTQLASVIPPSPPPHTCELCNSGLMQKFKGEPPVRNFLFIQSQGRDGQHGLHRSTRSVHQICWKLKLDLGTQESIRGRKTSSSTSVDRKLK